MKIPFSPPYIDQSVIDEVVDSLQSGWITTGPKCKLLEKELKSYTGAQQVLAVNSWTSGAILMLSWLGIKLVTKLSFLLIPILRRRFLSFIRERLL